MLRLNSLSLLASLLEVLANMLGLPHLITKVKTKFKEQVAY